MKERMARARRALMAMAAWIGALAGAYPARAAVVDFESAAYVHGNTIDQVDGWSRSATLGGQPESFRAYAEGSGQGAPGTGSNTFALKAAAPWRASGLEEVTARHAEIQNGEVQGVVGIAYESVDRGSNSGWQFPQAQADSTQPPRFNPPGTSFIGSMTLALEPVTEGSTLYYTLDGNTPAAEPANRYTGPIVLTASVTVKAMAVKAGMADSRVVSQSYTRLNVDSLAKPSVTPAGGSFADSVLVTLDHPAISPSGPAITLYYRLGNGLPIRYDRPFHLHPPAVLRAFAMRGAEQSDTATFTFHRRPWAPAILPAGRRFPDTLRITLDSDEDDVPIFYTLNGRDPDSASIPYLGKPILLDSTATLKAVAIRPGAGASLIRSESFELVPDSLSANYLGGDYSSAIQIKLRVTSLRARIHYTLDGSRPGPGNPASRPYVEGDIGFPLDTTATLRAVAAAGEGASYREGREFTARYTFIDAGVRTLGPGQRVEISPRYSVQSPSAGAPAVLVEVIKADSLRALRGFRDVQFGMDISLPSRSGAYPQVVFAAPAGEERPLYSLSPSGIVRFVSADDTVPLPSTGTYFLGVDTMPPRVVWSGENFHGDSTRILFSIQDNVSSLLLDLERSDAAPVRARELDNPHILTVTLKAPDGPVSSLWLRLKVDDRRNTTLFPSDPAGAYPLSQKAAAARSPEVLKVGASAERPWDMVSIPLDIPGRFSLARLRQENPGRVLAAKVMDAATGAYRDLKAGEALAPGAAMWLASDANLSSLALGPMQTAARQGRDTVQVRLRPGWNQIANPTLRDLVWPHPRGAPGSETSFIKHLHGYDPSLPGSGYYDADTLKPWKGYFVLHKGSRDTLVTLRTSMPAAGAARAAKAAAPAGVRLRIRLDRLPALHLGALPSAGDGLGVEDEPQPPAPGGDAERGPRLWSTRQRLRLGTDILGFRPGAVMGWRVVASGSVQDTSPSAGAAVEGLSLPEGYAAWAVSRSRGLRFALREGARIPLGAEADSLDVYAGPSALLEERLGRVPERVGAFRLSAMARPGGYALDLSLPASAAVAWSLWSPDGRRLDAASRVLPPGRYTLAGGARGLRGTCLLRLDWVSAGGPGAPAGRGREVRTLILP